MAKQDERSRLLALSERDRVFWTQDSVVLAGMDEVGRGPLAGPVVVACVVMPPEPLIAYVNDSKKVTEKRREVVYEQILNTCIEAKTAWVDAETIDRINILEATKLAFAEAFSKMETPITDVLIDALKGLNISARQHSLIHGDALSYSIAAASILAKVSRDRYMLALDEQYPQYAFPKHKGYGTKVHCEALQTYGPSPEHRLSFLRNILG